MADEQAERVLKRIKQEFSWPGKFELVAAPFEFAEGSIYDPPTRDLPEGNVQSIGEIIDAAINGTYVNAFGEIKDNGMNNFDTIIVLHLYFCSDSSDILYGSREEIFGNYIVSSQGGYARDDKDANGAQYNTEDIDEDLFTVKVFDGTGWPSIPGCAADPARDRP